MDVRTRYRILTDRNPIVIQVESYAESRRDRRPNPREEITPIQTLNFGISITDKVHDHDDDNDDDDDDDFDNDDEDDNVEDTGIQQRRGHQHHLQ